MADHRGEGWTMEEKGESWRRRMDRGGEGWNMEEKGDHGEEGLTMEEKGGPSENTFSGCF